MVRGAENPQPSGANYQRQIPGNEKPFSLSDDQPTRLAETESIVRAREFLKLKPDQDKGKAINKLPINHRPLILRPSRVDKNGDNEAGAEAESREILSVEANLGFTDTDEDVGAELDKVEDQEIEEEDESASQDFDKPEISLRMSKKLLRALAATLLSFEGQAVLADVGAKVDIEFIRKIRGAANSGQALPWSEETGREIQEVLNYANYRKRKFFDSNKEAGWLRSALPKLSKDPERNPGDVFFTAYNDLRPR